MCTSLVAWLLGMSTQEIEPVSMEGRLPAHRPGGQREYVLYVDEVVEWLKAHPIVASD